MLEVQGLSKSFGGFRAVSGVDLAVGIEQVRYDRTVVEPAASAVAISTRVSNSTLPGQRVPDRGR